MALPGPSRITHLPAALSASTPAPRKTSPTPGFPLLTLTLALNDLPSDHHEPDFLQFIDICKWVAFNRYEVC